MQGSFPFQPSSPLDGGDLNFYDKAVYLYTPRARSCLHANKNCEEALRDSTSPRGCSASSLCSRAPWKRATVPVSLRLRLMWIPQLSQCGKHGAKRMHSLMLVRRETNAAHCGDTCSVNTSGRMLIFNTKTHIDASIMLARCTVETRGTPAGIAKCDKQEWLLSFLLGNFVLVCFNDPDHPTTLYIYMKLGLSQLTNVTAHYSI